MRVIERGGGQTTTVLGNNSLLGHDGYKNCKLLLLDLILGEGLTRSFHTLRQCLKFWLSVDMSHFKQCRMEMIDFFLFGTGSTHIFSCMLLKPETHIVSKTNRVPRSPFFWSVMLHDCKRKKKQKLSTFTPHHMAERCEGITLQFAWGVGWWFNTKVSVSSGENHLGSASFKVIPITSKVTYKAMRKTLYLDYQHAYWSQRIWLLIQKPSNEKKSRTALANRCWLWALCWRLV